jgi:hypothetical protein
VTVALYYQHYGQVLANRLADILPGQRHNLPARKLARYIDKTVQTCPGCHRKTITTHTNGWSCYSCYSWVQTS